MRRSAMLTTVPSSMAMPEPRVTVNEGRGGRGRSRVAGAGRPARRVRSGQARPAARRTFSRSCSGVSGGRALRGQPVVDLLALGVAHQPDDVAGLGELEQRLERVELGRVGLDVGDADALGAGAQQPLELLEGAAAEVLLLVADRHDVGVAGGDLAEHLEQVVLAVADGAEAEQQPAAGRPDPAHDLDHRLEPGLVVGEVHHHRDLAHGEEVHPAGVVLGVGAERPQPGDDVLAVDAGGQGRRGGGERVLDVEAGQAAQGHRVRRRPRPARRRGCPRGR